jgi:hypothetical protein
MLKLGYFSTNCSKIFQNNLSKRKFGASIELSNQLHYQNAATFLQARKSQSLRVDFFSIIIIPSTKILKL